MTRDILPFSATTGLVASTALVTGTDYYYSFQRCQVLGTDTGLVESVQVQWAAGFAGTIGLEDTNFPEASETSVVAGEWIPENPIGSYIPVVGPATVSASTVTITAGAAGGCMFHLTGSGALRSRLKVVATTGALVRVAACFKAGV